MNVVSVETAERQRVAIILVNWNAWRDCVECIDSLMAQNHRRFGIFVVDNQSSDESLEHIEAWCRHPCRLGHEWREHAGVSRFTAGLADGRLSIPVRAMTESDPPDLPPHAVDEPGVTLIRANGNRGFAAGCNLGMRIAGLEAFDFFWLLNTDTVVHRDALTALVRHALSRPDLGLIGSTVRYYSEPQRVQALGGGQLDQRTMTTRHIGEGMCISQVTANPATVEVRLAHIFGASMLVPAEFLRHVGPMQEDYFLYYEEFDWALRGRPQFSLGYAPASHVFHKSGASSSKVMPAFTSRLYYRNRIRFASRHFPDSLAVIRRGLALDLLRQVCKGHWSTARILLSTLWNAKRLAREAIVD